jgi:hypothetical protein
MPTIWCSISGHGYGHAAQVVPILNELGRMVPGLHVILRTTVPERFFQQYLWVKWDLQEVQQDIGCLQMGPLDIDVPGTWNAYRNLHENWEEKVAREAEAMIRANVDLVVVNISHLGVAAGLAAGKPVVAIASLCWDQILEPLASADEGWHADILTRINQAYAGAHSLIRLLPGMKMPAFPKVSGVGPVFLPRPGPPTDVRRRLGLSQSERLVLIGFGGIPLCNLPLPRLAEMKGYHFVISGISVPKGWDRLTLWEDLGMPFVEVMSQADLVMTKAGYSTIVTAVEYGIPIVYVERGHFAEEPGLIEYARRFGRALALPRNEFESGEWEKVLRQVFDLPDAQVSPPEGGQGEAARLLLGYLKSV